MEYPKLLIISHNLYDTSNNIGKTLVSLLQGWPKERLSQIYFRNDMPSFKYCEQYYCITDKDILKSVLTLHLKSAGRAVCNSGDLSLTGTENSLYTIGNHRHPSVSLLRDSLWRISNWKTPGLKKWLDEVSKPDLILFVPNDYCLAYEVALHVQNIVNKPIAPFYMDDAFYWNCNINGIDKYRRKQLRELASCIHNHSRDLLTICDYMSDEYKTLFDRKCWAFVNSVKLLTPKNNAELGNPVCFTYLGNLHSNRWMSLVEIGKALDQIESKSGIRCVLRIFSGSILEADMRNAFKEVRSIEYKGSIPSTEVRIKQLESDILVHVEAFDTRSVNSTRLSLSTKIPEYLSTGVPVFAYGPADISSMRYLGDNNLGQICTCKDDLYGCIESLLTSPENRESFINNGIKRASEYHDIDKVSKNFQDILKNYCL